MDDDEKITVPITWDVDAPDKTEPGDLVTFTLMAKDLHGNPFDVKPGQLTAILSVNDKARGLCEEQGKRRKIGVGAYSFDFIPRILGKHQLRLQNGHLQLFRDTQIILDVLKEVPDADIDYEFELEGQGLLSARLNEVVNLNIIVKEKGSPVDIDTSKFSVKIFGNGRAFLAQVQRRGLGRYTATCTTTSPGIYSATVIYDEHKVLKQRIEFYEHTSTRCSKVDNVPVNVPVGQPSKFTIQSLDMHGNLTGVGGDLWEVKITEGPKPAVEVPLRIVDHLNGKYSVEFQLFLPGVYRVDVLLQGESAKKSPFKIKAE